MPISIFDAIRIVLRWPIPTIDKVTDVMFAAGAGRYEKYSKCASTVLSFGQFYPEEIANPHLGKPGLLERVMEARVETVCEGRCVEKVVKALV